MIGKIENIVVTIGMVVFIVCNMVYDFYPIKGIWYIGNSFAFVCYAYVLNRVINNTITKILLAVVCSQLLDELYGDPTKPDVVEYIGFFGILVFFWINKYLKGKRSNEKK